MDFSRPLRRLEGFIVYTTLLDYIDTFVHEYSAQKDGKEFPSLKQTTRMIQSLLQDLGHVELSDLKEDEDTNIAEMLETLGQRLSEARKEINEFDERIQKQLVKEPANEKRDRWQANKVEEKTKTSSNKEIAEPRVPFVLSGEKDIALLRSWGISEKELSVPKKKRKPKSCE